MPETKTPGVITLDHYEVLTREDGSPFELGRGAMGITYKAMDTSLRIVVALKVINSRFLNSDMARTRFVREARAAAKLRHRNVASVFHLGNADENYFYAMEFIDGETVEALIRRTGPQPPLTALRIAHQVARALNAAEQHGLVHRDIKPANLMLVKEDDELCVKVIDFGLVKVQENEREDEAAVTATQAGFFGTPQFASPEQLREDKLDVRSDIYSLGATLWYMLAGEAPFCGSLAKVMSLQLGAPPPVEKLAGLPEPVEALLLRMLAKSAAERPQSASALRKEIEECIEKVAGGPGAAAARAALEEQKIAAPLDDGASRAGRTVFQPGTLVAGRYEILRPLRESNIGAEFQARDESKCDVRLVALHPQYIGDRELYTKLERQVDVLRNLDHANLLRIESLEVMSDGGLLLLEWTNGFSLLDVLRVRRELGAAEVVPILHQIAAGIDYAVSAGVKRLSLALHQILVHFPGGMEAGRNLREIPVTDWPPYVVKLNPLNISADSSLSETWAGERTMVADESVAVPGEAANPLGASVHGLGNVAYQLLGGKLDHLGSASSATRFVPLASLTEGGNAVLKRTIEAPESFGSAVEFATFLGDLQGLGSKDRASVSAAISASRATVPPRTSATRPPPLAPPVAAPQPSVPPPIRTPTMPPPVPAAKPSSPVLPVSIVAAVLLLATGAFLVIKRPWESHPEKPPISQTDTPPSTPAPVNPDIPPVAPEPNKLELQKAAVDRAEAVEAKGNLADSIMAWADVVKKFPDAGKPKLYLGRIPYTLRERNTRLTDEEFAQLAEPLKAAAEMDIAGAMVLLGDGYIKSAPATAFYWYSRAADLDERAGLTKVGLMLASGDGTDRNLEKAITYFERASEKGDPQAQGSLAECLLDGKGVPKDEKRGIDLLKSAADGGYPRAINRLGDYYRKGFLVNKEVLVKRDVEKAHTLFVQAADKGDLEAYGNLGVVYLMGEGNVAKDEIKGLDYFQKGADKGNAFCMYLLAMALESGTGTDANPKEAEKWYRKAAIAGHAKAKDWCDKHGIVATKP